jgi:hypothetical protein
MELVYLLYPVVNNRKPKLSYIYVCVSMFQSFCLLILNTSHTQVRYTHNNCELTTLATKSALLNTPLIFAVVG